MLILLGLIVLLALGTWLERRCMFGCVLSTVAGGTLIFAVVLFCLSHLTAGSTIAEYNALKAAIERARLEDRSEIERAAILTSILDMNRSIARVKYWNNTSLDVFFSDALAELEPLE